MQAVWVVDEVLAERSLRRLSWRCYLLNVWYVWHAAHTVASFQGVKKSCLGCLVISVCSWIPFGRSVFVSGPRSDTLSRSRELGNVDGERLSKLS